MLDLLAAFDTVSHKILVDPLQQSCTVKGLTLFWIESILRSQT